MRTLPARLIAIVLLTVSLAAPVAGASDEPPIEVSVDCVSSPECVRITNNRARPIVIKSIGSIHQRRAGEPYKVRKKLKPGKSVTYSFGRGTLQAVSAGANRQQGDRDPSSWLPADRETACRFVVDWVAVKASWDLALDDDERLAIESTLQFCDDREVTVVEREPASPRPRSSSR